MISFKLFCEKSIKPTKVNFFAATDINGPKGSRHRANIIKDIGTRKHTETVPVYKRPDPDIIQKVEKIKSNFSHYEPINDIQLKKICKKYKVYNVNKNEIKKLGNTGIAIVWDENLKTFALKK
jgi:hypothetical protein